jgi:hypothetical protein
MRGRGGNQNQNQNRKGPNPLTRNYESNGPDVKIRGSAQQIAEKYTTLARDAQSSGDRVMAENYLQHAEHYNRIIMAALAQMPQQQMRDQRDDDDGDDDGDESLAPAQAEQPQQQSRRRSKTRLRPGRAPRESAKRRSRRLRPRPRRRKRLKMASSPPVSPLVRKRRAGCAVRVAPASRPARTPWPRAARAPTAKRPSPRPPNRFPRGRSPGQPETTAKDSGGHWPAVFVCAFVAVRLARS